MAAACQFPEELLMKPLGYVALIGLQTQVNAMHLSIWDTFTVNRKQDNVLNIKLLPGDFEFPKRKQKRSSYEFYVPKGILKTYWMRKHLEILPALVVVFYDLDWNDVQWKEKQLECASRVAVIRSSLQGRNTKIAVVLIQKNMPLPPGEDPQAVQHAESLCQACELPSKSLFVLPFSDHLHGYITRLEGAFYDIAQGYYTNEARNVKQHREMLNKSQHQLLFVRHQFKIAFLSELKPDGHVALKHYKQAYSFILEQKLNDINNLEVKLVAGFLNYKICKICFQLNAPLDAISHFRKHIDFYKSKPGYQLLMFEHCAWMAKQFSLFGDLFQDAIKNGLQAIQTQHPGFYYQQAADHSINRRKFCQSVCKYYETTTPDPLENAKNLGFFGHRPWRQGCQANEAPDPNMEQAGILALQSQELTVDHSWIIIPLLGSAVTQFREYKSVRMKLWLMVQMGEEYYHAKDYAKALTLLNRVMPFYRGEHWWWLLTRVLHIALKCAFLTVSIQDYIVISMEMIGRCSTIDSEEKLRIQANLMKINDGSAPAAEPGCALDAVQSATSAWVEKLNATEPITIDVHSLAGFIECRLAFDSDSYRLDEVAHLKAFIRSSGPLPIVFSELGVQFSNLIYNSDCVMKDQPDQLILHPGSVLVHDFKFMISPDDVHKKLEVKQIYLCIGSLIILRWHGAGLDANVDASYDSSCYGGERLPKRTLKNGSLVWESITTTQFTEILPRAACIELTIDSQPPSLVDEVYQLKVNIQNNELKEINDIKLVVSLTGEVDDDNVKAILAINSENNAPDEECHQQLEIAGGSLCPNAKLSKSVYLKSKMMRTEQVRIEVTYDMFVEMGEEKVLRNCHCSKDEAVQVITQMPFSVAVKMANSKFQQISKANADEPFCLMTYVKSTSPHAIVIVSTCFELNSDFSFFNNHTEQISEIEMREGDSIGECQCLIASATEELTRNVQIGHYNVFWRRAEGTTIAMTQVNFPSATIDHIPFYVKTDIPPYGCVEEPLLVQFTVYNRTNVVQKVEAAVEPSDVFVFSGNSQVQLRILPLCEQLLTFSMYPLQSGELVLPKLHLKLPQYHNLNSDILTQQMVPMHIFIK